MIDALRRMQKQSSSDIPDQAEEFPIEVLTEVIKDDMVKMIFACCHPSLSAEYQIILTLKILGGLSIREISFALLKKEDTVAKAYARAKKKFKKEEIVLRLPLAHEIENRLNMVLKIIYLLFNEGYKTAEGTTLVRQDICKEAIRLNRVLMESTLCNTPSVNALMALMHFHASRFDARTDEDGEIISLEHQDRGKWNQELISSGMDYLQKASVDKNVNDYIVQAAISAIHCTAKTFDETNWTGILELYDLQIRINTNPIIRLNRIIPLEKVHGPFLASGEIEELEKTGFFDDYYLFYAIKSDVFERMGEIGHSIEALEQAISLAKNEKEKNHLTKRLNHLRNN